MILISTGTVQQNIALTTLLATVTQAISEKWLQKLTSVTLIHAPENP